MASTSIPLRRRAQSKLFMGLCVASAGLGLTMLAIKRSNGTSVFQQTTTQSPSQQTGTGTAPATGGSALPKLPEAPVGQ